MSLTMEYVDITSRKEEQDIPGSECIGNGYNVLDAEYASPQFTTRQLFDLTNKEEKQIDEKHTYNIPANVEHKAVQQGDFRVIAGKTIEEHQSKLLVEAGISGGYSGFRGSLDTSFARSAFRRSSIRYVTYMDIVKRWMLTLAGEPRDLLLPEVETDINFMSPTKLFDTYGTHYLKRIIVGARATYSSTISEIDYESKYGLDIVAQMSYKDLIGTKVETKYEESVRKFQENSDSRVRVLGGNPAYAVDIFEEGYDAWSESTDERPVFMDFGLKGLQPIWGLCRDDDRKYELEAAYEDYVGKKSEQIQRFPLQTDDLIALKADTDAYLSRIHRDGRDPIEAAKWGIDPYSRFTVTVLHPGKIALQADTGKYLSRIHRDGRDPIEAAKTFEDRYAIDKFSEFTVEYLDKETIALRADTDAYLSRIHRDGRDSIEAAKSKIDDFCKFSVDIL